MDSTQCERYFVECTKKKNKSCFIQLFLDLLLLILPSKCSLFVLNDTFQNVSQMNNFIVTISFLHSNALLDMP